MTEKAKLGYLHSPTRPETPRKPEAKEELPVHVKRMARGGYACLHCGGSVGAEGYSMGGEVEEAPPEKDEVRGDKPSPEVHEKTRLALFARAIKGDRYGSGRTET